MGLHECLEKEHTVPTSNLVYVESPCSVTSHWQALTAALHLATIHILIMFCFFCLFCFFGKLCLSSKLFCELIRLQFLGLGNGFTSAFQPRLFFFWSAQMKYTQLMIVDRRCRVYHAKPLNSEVFFSNLCNVTTNAPNHLHMNSKCFGRAVQKQSNPRTNNNCSRPYERLHLILQSSSKT